MQEIFARIGAKTDRFVALHSHRSEKQHHESKNPSKSNKSVGYKGADKATNLSIISLFAQETESFAVMHRMKTSLAIALLLASLPLRSVTASDQIIPTSNKFSADLKASLSARIAMANADSKARLTVRQGGSLPLEFVTGKGLGPSDGFLSVGDSFAWPGCGFDRTSYTIVKMAVDYVEVSYTRGTPALDGYRDEGSFRISYEPAK